MERDKNCDLRACLSIQPRRSYTVPARKTQELASELLSLVNNDSVRAMQRGLGGLPHERLHQEAIAIIREIMYYSPNRQIDWYYERAIEKLNRLRLARK